MIKERKVSGVCLAVTILFCLGIPGARAQDSEKARFLAEIPKNWAALKPFLSALEGSFTCTEKWPEDPKRDNQYSVDFLISGNRVRFEKRSGKRVRAGAINPDYFFMLNRDPGADRYAVESMERLKQANPMVEDVFASIAVRFVNAPWNINGEPLVYWLEHPEYFTATSVKREVRDSRSVVRLDYERQWVPPMVPPGRTVPELPSERKAPRTGWCIVDPDRYWIILECQEKAWWGTHHRKLEYGEPIDGFPRLTKVRQVDRGSGVVEYSWDMDRLARKQAPDSEFTLRSFGISEPAFGSALTRHWVWFACLAVLCLGSAIAVRRYLRNRRKAAPLA